MSYKGFQKKINGLLAGLGLTAEFAQDTYRGKYIAKISDGTIITGTANGLKVTVGWGSGHIAMAEI